MKLRKLELRDAENMLEWMHDAELCENLHADFASKTLSDCIEFIKSAMDASVSLHMAIADDSDEYMGTASLKNISTDERCAEFGIVVRRCAMGKGYSIFGMREIIEYGFDSLNLKSVFWCVSKNNIRACSFYNKHNFRVVDEKSVPSSITEKYAGVPDLLWYEVANNEYSQSCR